MRPTEFPDQVIIEAGLALEAAGRNVTGFALRQKIGGGAQPRLRQIWNEFLASKRGPQAAPVAELPIEVAEQLALVTNTLSASLSALAVEVNDKAVKAAERRVTDLVRAAGEQRAQAEHELADASATVDDLENKLDEANALVDSLSERLRDAGISAQAQAVDLAKATERLASTEAQAQKDLAAHQRAIDDLKSRHEVDGKKELEKHEKERLQHSQEIEQKLSEIKTLTNTVAKGLADLSAVRSELVDAKSEHAAALTISESKKAAAEKLSADIRKEMQDQKQASEKAMNDLRQDMLDRLKDAETRRDTAQAEAVAAREEAARLLGQTQFLMGTAGKPGKPGKPGEPGQSEKAGK